jgi:hypothetical protein
MSKLWKRDSKGGKLVVNGNYFYPANLQTVTQSRGDD